MSKKVIFKMLVCAILCAAALRDTRAQTNAPAANPPTQGGAGRGGFGGFGRGPQPPPGPPAPVPPEVSMPRPTAEEVAKMNAEIKKFIQKSSDRKLLEKYEPLMLVQIPRDNPCIRPTGGGVCGRPGIRLSWTRPTPTILTSCSKATPSRIGGSSSLRRVGPRFFKKYFGDAKVADFAVAGDTTQGLLWGLQNGEGQGHKPRAIMLMIGTNNTGSNSGPEIAEGVGADLLELRKDFPDAKILLLAIFPRGAGPSDPNRRKNEEANKIIAKLHDGQHVFFMNINDKFLDPDGRLIGFRNDNLHPNPQGYEIWASAVAPTLKGWLR